MIIQFKSFESRYDDIIIGQTVEMVDIWEVLNEDEYTNMVIHSDFDNSDKIATVGDKIKFTSNFGETCYGKIERSTLAVITPKSNVLWKVTINSMPIADEWVPKGAREFIVQNVSVQIYTENPFLKTLLKRIEVHKKTSRFDL